MVGPELVREKPDQFLVQFPGTLQPPGDPGNPGTNPLQVGPVCGLLPGKVFPEGLPGRLQVVLPLPLHEIGLDVFSREIPLPLAPKPLILLPDPVANDHLPRGTLRHVPEPEGKFVFPGQFPGKGFDPGIILRRHEERDQRQGHVHTIPSII